jgi:hypothetical protein
MNNYYGFGVDMHCRVSREEIEKYLGKVYNLYI